MLRRGTRLLGGGIMSGFWTLCSLFFPCPSWVSLYGYFPVLVKLIWLFLAPVLVLLDYVRCVYKSLVLPESLSVHLSIYVVFPASFPHHTTVTHIVSSAVKRLIAINRIQNKYVCLHNICMCAVFIYYVYINTNTCMYILQNIFMFIY